MVENSLGRLWLEGHPDEELKSEWRYYLDEAEQEPAVQAQLEAIRAEYRNMDPTEIKVIDPCMGSGHILVYAFDVLMQIYQSAGWSQRDAARNIVQNNLYGLDIDDRAAQLAYFAVMMKGCQYDRRFLKRQLQPNVFAIAESGRTDAKGNHEWLVSSDTIDYFADGNEALRKDAMAIRDAMFDAKEYGSILTMPKVDFETMKNRIDELWDEFSMYRDEVINTFWPVLRVAEALAQKYDVVVTNPPYMGGSMNAILVNHLKQHYPDTKSDLFAVFIDRCHAFCKKNRKAALVTPEAWMFLLSYAPLRNRLLSFTHIDSLIHLGNGAFEVGFGTSAFVFTTTNSQPRFKGTFLDLRESKDKENSFFEEKRIFPSTTLFYELPDNVLAYWCSLNLVRVFKHRSIGDSTRYELESGIVTGDNAKFLRLWHEVSQANTALQNPSASCLDDNAIKWMKCNKGGGYHKWYGAYEYVINIGYGASDIKAVVDSSIYRLRNPDNYFLHGINWPYIGINKFSAKFTPYDVINNKAANSIHFHGEIDYCLFAYLNSVVFNVLLNMINPTVNYPVANIGNAPYKRMNDVYVEEKVKECIHLARNDWDAFEASWDFQRHPLVAAIPKGGPAFEVGNIYLSECYQIWEGECDERFKQLKANEEELNRIFIDIYGLQDELTPEVEDKDVTVRLADLKRDVKSLISYAVGCMFGRYSLDEAGLAYAGGEWDASKYSTFSPARTNIIPICDDDYFEDDITNRFVEWIKTVYGENTLEENLKFIADALGGKGTPRDVIRSYFLNDFYADHVKLYQKRPIYWLFDSGKKGGFRALIYMHRYQPDTIARVRTDYVHELQSRYRTAIEGLEERIIGASPSERARLSKRLKSLKEQADEIHAYEEKIHHLADQMISIDLDDGVKKNYEIFKDVLAKIK